MNSRPSWYHSTDDVFTCICFLNMYIMEVFARCVRNDMVCCLHHVVLANSCSRPHHKIMALLHGKNALVTCVFLCNLTDVLTIKCLMDLQRCAISVTVRLLHEILQQYLWNVFNTYNIPWLTVLWHYTIWKQLHDRYHCTTLTLSIHYLMVMTYMRFSFSITNVLKSTKY